MYSRLATEADVLPRLAKMFRKSDVGERAALAYSRLVNAPEQYAPLLQMREHHRKKGNKQRQRIFEKHLSRAHAGVLCQSDPGCYANMLSKSPNEIAQSMEELLPDIRSWSGRDKVELKNPAVERSLIQLAKMGSLASATTDMLLMHLDYSDESSRLGEEDTPGDLAVRRLIIHALARVAPTPCDKCIARLERVTKTLDFVTLPVQESMIRERRKVGEDHPDARD